jgi:hypothetical protein
MKRISRILFLVFSLFATAAFAQEAETFKISPTKSEHKHRRWYKDWKWWVGEALIVGPIAADMKSSTSVRDRCPLCSETNPLLGRRPSDKRFILFGAGFAATLTASHIVARHYGKDSDEWGARFVSQWAIPVTMAGIETHAAMHNNAIQ